MSFKILDMLCMKFCNPSNPCGERSLARGRLNALALCFLANAFALLKINNCHCGLDPQSQELSISSIAFLSSLIPLSLSSSTEGRRSSLSEAVKLQMRGVGSSLRRDFVMLNLFQHLTSLACSLFINKILKQVQDDTIRNFRNELFNLSTLQLKNLACFVCPCLLTPHPSPLLKERENPVTNLTPQHLNVLTPLSQCKTWRTLPC